MLLTTDRRLVQIPIKTICYQGFSATIDGHVIELDHTAQGIVLTTDGYHHPSRFRVHEQQIKCLELSNGGFCPVDRSTIFYVFGRDGRRYKYLYLFNGPNFEIGTRGDFPLRYPCQTRSKRQRRIWKAGGRIRFKPHRLKQWAAVDEAQQDRRRRERQASTIVPAGLMILDNCPGCRRSNNC
jgi:hypothetical protein